MLETDTQPSAVDTTVFLKNYQAPDWQIPKTNLQFDLHEEFVNVRAVLQLERQGEHNKPLVLDGEKLEMLAIHVDGRALSDKEYTLTDTSLTLVELPAQCEIEINNRLYPQNNTELSGLYTSSGNFCTQCEAEGFRRITWFLDRPDVLSKYTVTISADKTQYPVLLSNGNPVDHGQNSDGRHWQTWSDPHPKPSYLFALVAGQLDYIQDQFTTQGGRLVDLRIYTQAHNIDKCDYAMQALINSMRWDEEVYGREYDLDVYNIVAVDDFNMGAMENKGLNIFNSKYVLADQQTATDQDFQGVESVIAHEYFHNWSGNRVTCRDWFQLSLKEGFTVFRDQQFSEDMGSAAVNRIENVDILRTHQFKEDAGPMAHPVRPESYQEINNFYTVTIYNKGAEVIRMMHQLVGEQGYRKGTDLYFARHDGQAVTTEDFVLAMEAANDVDLGQFRRWYTQAGTPHISVTSNYDKKEQRFSLHLSQSCPPTPEQSDKQPFQIPVRVALYAANGEKLQPEKVLSFDQPQQTFEFCVSQEPVAVSFLRGFTAPVKVSFAQSDHALSVLMRNDDDGYVRWQSSQELQLNLLLPAIEHNTELDANRYAALQANFEHVLTQPSSDLAIDALLLTVPSEAYLAEQLDVIDPLLIHQQRKTLITMLAKDRASHWLATYQKLNAETEFTLCAESMAKRSLKNTALKYLLASESQQAFELAKIQYDTASNMTDRLAAFVSLVHSSYAHKQDIIDDFYARFKEQSLVLDKWFSTLASEPHQDTLQQVKALEEHEKFSLNNPNKVRALISSFAANNALAFHNEDGSGHAYIAQKVIELDKINPQIAARLVSVFNQWHRFTPAISTSMRKQLEKIQGKPGLSKDVAEIVGKALVSTTD